MGGSLGGATAGLVLSETEVPIEAAVLINPLIDLRAGIDAIAASFGMTYPWSDASYAVADRLDLAAHAPDLAKRGEPAVLLIVGEEDLVDGMREPAYRVQRALTDSYADPSRTEVRLIAGMGHNLTEEPGIEPAPQTEYAARTDALASAWFERFLVSQGHSFRSTSRDADGHLQLGDSVGCVLRGVVEVDLARPGELLVPVASHPAQ